MDYDDRLYEDELLAELEATSTDELAGRVLPGTYASVLDELGLVQAELLDQVEVLSEAS
jgi:hypothetical protein